MKSHWLTRVVQIVCFTLPLLMFGVLYFFLLKLPPAPTNPQNIAHLFYLDKNYDEAVNILRKEVNEDPDNFDARLLFAMSLLRTPNKNEAEAEWRYLYSKYPKRKEIQIGLAEAYLANYRFKEATSLLEKLRIKYPNNGEVLLLLGEVYYKKGDNIKAGRLYQYMIQKKLDEDEAEKRFRELVGLPKDEPPLQVDLTHFPYNKPDEMQILFRTHHDYFEVSREGEWHAVYLKGLNYSTASPGHYVSDPPKDFKEYAKWLKIIADMNCNVVRLYTLCTPAFYQALKVHNETYEKKLWLFQEIWLPERDPRFQAIKEAFNLEDISWTEEMKKEITYAIDVLHGKGNVPYKKGRSSGIYLADISPWVIALGIGNELPSYIAVETNENNRANISYAGKYVNLMKNKGSPVEVWFAKICDFTIDYELNIYNCQRPITIINWPPLDPLYHTSEASYAEQMKWQKIYGLPLTPRFKTSQESDVVDIDIMDFKPTPIFKAGFFACYHVYPYWPGFIWQDAKYLPARDPKGPNPYFGYVTDLKTHHKNFPLLLAEYGMSTSWYPAVITEGSTNEGGFSYYEQAEWLKRTTENIFKSRYAGGFIFELYDEWWHNSVSLSYFVSFNEKPLWFNVADGESCFGVVTFESPSPRPLLRGEEKDWENALLLASGPFLKPYKPGQLKRLHASSDFTFLYLRLDIEPQITFDSDNMEYWIALSTLPDRIGSHGVPDLDLYFESGINFLIRLKPHNNGSLLVEKNYMPAEWIEAPAILGGKTLIRKNSIPQMVVEEGSFEELILPISDYKISRDGTITQATKANFSELRYGTADPKNPAFDNRAAWHMDIQKGMIEIRIPWQLLFITPPNRSTMIDITQISEGVEQAIRTEEIPGIKIAAISLSEDGHYETLPKSKKGIISSKKMPLYTWEKWTVVPPYDIYLKESYFAMQKIFSTLKLDIQEPLLLNENQ